MISGHGAILWFRNEIVIKAETVEAMMQICFKKSQSHHNKLNPKRSGQIKELKPLKTKTKDKP